MMPFSTIEEALDDFRAGKFLLVTDDASRENEGDLIMAAQFVDAAAINFMARYKGLICVPMEAARLAELRLGPMELFNTDRHATAFVSSVDAHPKFGTTTGISASDRAKAVQLLIDPSTRPADLTRPGHTFPLQAREGGILVRAGHTEASVDLCKLAGLYPAAVICEVLNDSGEAANLPELTEIARQHDLKIISIEDLIRYRRAKEKLVRRVAEARLPTAFGEFIAVAYESVLDGTPYVALVHGEMQDGKIVGDAPTLVRVHSGCLTGDALLSLRCDCGEQLHAAMNRIAEEGRGVLLYIDHHEGRGIGILNKIRAYALQDEGADTEQANHALGFASDLREYGTGAQVLADLGVSRMRLLTNNPAKRVGLEGYGLQIVERVPLQPTVHAENRPYLRTKRDKMGHLLDELSDQLQPNGGVNGGTAIGNASTHIVSIYKDDEQIEEQSSGSGAL
jgi:3,4-dihydroxy 2-butanone 4-phosphate synthase / GTP cyclohydrolase II